MENAWFLIKYPNYFISCISHYYSLKEKQLTHYKKYLDWLTLSYRSDLPWSIDFIQKFEDVLDWGHGKYHPGSIGISENKSIPWSIELLEAFKKNLNWEILSRDFDIISSPEVLAKFKDLFDMNEVVETFIAKINHYKAELYTEQNFKTQESINTNSENKITLRVEEYFHINNIPESSDLYEICKQEDIIWDEYMLEKFKDHLNWENLCFKGNVNWTLELLDKYAERIDWGLIVCKKNIWDQYFSGILTDEMIDSIFSEILLESH